MKFIIILFFYFLYQAGIIIINHSVRLPVVFPFLIILFIFAVYFAVGRKIIKLLKLEFDNFEILIFGFAVGLLLNILIIYFLAVIKIYNLILYLIFFFIQALFILDLRNENWYEKIISFYRANKKIFLPLTISLTIVLFWSNTPNIFFDVQSYHLSIPRRIIAHSAYPTEPYNIYFFFPPAYELISTFLLSLNIDYRLTQLFNCLIFILIFLSIIKISKDYFKIKNIFLTVSIILFIPSLIELSSISKNDILLVFAELNALYSFLKYLKSSEKKYLFGALIFNSLGLWIKYIFFYYIIAEIFIYIIFSQHRTIKDILMLFILPFIIFSPIMLKNLILTGNPIYPALYSIFGSNNYFKSDWFNYVQIGYDNIIDYFFIPINIFVNSGSFGSNMGFIPLPAIILFFIFVLIDFKKFKNNLNIILFIVINLLLWSKNIAITRFILSIVIFINIGFIYIMENYFFTNKTIKIIFAIFVVAGISYNLLISAVEFETQFKSFKFINSNLFPSEYLKNDALYNAAGYINKRKSNYERVMLIGELRAYYFIGSAISNSELDKTVIIEWIRECKMDDKKLLSKFKKENIKYILINLKEGNRLNLEYNYFYWQFQEYEFFTRFLNKYFKLVYNKDGILVHYLID